MDELTALVSDEAYPRNLNGANRTLRRFTIFSFIFAANPSAALACLSLATARLGKVGAWSSGMLYLTYTLSSVLGATYVVKQLGGRNSMMLGMSFYVVYVACFWVAVSHPSIEAPALSVVLLLAVLVVESCGLLRGATLHRQPKNMLSIKVVNGRTVHRRSQEPLLLPTCWRRLFCTFLPTS